MRKIELVYQRPELDDAARYAQGIGTVLNSAWVSTLYSPFLTQIVEGGILTISQTGLSVKIDYNHSSGMQVSVEETEICTEPKAIGRNGKPIPVEPGDLENVYRQLEAAGRNVGLRMLAGESYAERV